jgi:hypothetical protein
MKKFLMGILLLMCFTQYGQIKVQSKFLGIAKKGSKGELEIIIHKENINSFAKYQLEFPKGISVSEGNIKGGNFSVEGNKAKIVWVNLPSEKEFTITLKLFFNDDNIFPATLYQKFYYLENSIKKEVSGEPVVINSNESVNEEISLKNNSNTTTTNTTESSPPKQNVITSNSSNQNNNVIKTDEQKKSVETPKTNPSNEEFTYKIQLAASATKPDENSYSNVGKVEIIFHKGMYKVMIDKTFSTKEEALQYREQIIQKGYSGAFLVKYKNGQRVN